MKGYTINNILYVFDANPAAIPSVGASVTTIYVQQEQLDAWKTANESYASLMQPYNYKLLSVQPKVWADYVNQDIPVPHDVTVSGDNVVTTDATDLIEGDIFKFKPAANYYISSASAVCGQDAVTITDLVGDADGYTKSFVMPDGDVTLTISTALIPYDVTVSGDNVVTTETNDVTPGTTFKFKPASGYNLTSASAVCGEDAVTITDLVDDADGYTKAFTMPYGNVTLTVVTELIPVLVTYDYACYSTLDEENPEVTGQFTSYGEVTRTDTVDGVELQLIPCTVTQSTQEAMIGATIYADANDMQYIGTDTKCKYYVLVEDVMAWSQYYVTISIAE